jgi:predicted nucleic acid-binding protein
MPFCCTVRHISDSSNCAWDAASFVPANSSEVRNIVDRLSAQYTMSDGHRALDVLHVATALHLGAREFLSFDENNAHLPKRRV